MDTNINDTTPPVATAIDLQYPNTSMFGPTVLAILFTLSVAVIYRRGQKKSTPENREPPVLTSKIPFFGHLIGMLRWQVGYMQMLRYIETVTFNNRRLDVKVVSITY